MILNSAEFADPAIVALHAELAKHPVVEEYQQLALQWRSIDRTKRSVLPGVSFECRQCDMYVSVVPPKTCI